MDKAAMSSPRYADLCDECALEMDMAWVPACSRRVNEVGEMSREGGCRLPPFGTWLFARCGLFGMLPPL
jgi:hypothetical protein